MGLDNFLRGTVRAVQRGLGRGTPTHARRARAPIPEPENLIRQLRQGGTTSRLRAARLLGEMMVTDASPELARMALDDRRKVRRAALGALLIVDPEQFANSAVALSEPLPIKQLFSDFDAILKAVATARTSMP